MHSEVVFDFARRERIGVDEAVLCIGKSASQLNEILNAANERSVSILLTRLSNEQELKISPDFRKHINYDDVSRTAFFGDIPPPSGPPAVAIVSAGSSDVPVAKEAKRTLEFHGLNADTYFDIGVAGLWRLNERIERLAEYASIIVVAGMDGALPSVIAGLFGSLIIAVPTSAGYGASEYGKTALYAALSSCAPGLVVVNIDNGYGAAIAIIRALGATSKSDIQ